MSHARPQLSHPLAGADLVTLLRLVAGNGAVARGGWPVLALALGSALGRLPLSGMERTWVAVRRPATVAPLFILGHWRSGTTHLYNLLARAPRYAYVPPVATGLPWDFLLLGRLLRPLLDRALPETRYIDNVPVHPDSPQEDEIALAGMTEPSFYHGIYFPRHFHRHFARGVFLEDVPPAMLARWRQRFLHLHAKIALAQPGRRLLIKNPPYTARVALLRQMFPDAQFIHIHRDPQVLFRSARNFYQKLFPRFALQDWSAIDIDRHILETYPRIMQRLVEDTADLPSDRFVEVAFADLETRPLAVLERIYGQLNLAGFAEDRPRFAAYLDSVRDYQKNDYGARQEDPRVTEAWAPFLARWGYAQGAA